MAHNLSESPAGSIAGRQSDESSGTLDWHRLPAADVLHQVGSSTDGLTSSVAADRLAEVGSNELIDNGSTSPWRIVWEQISAVMVLILIGAALLVVTPENVPGATCGSSAPTLLGAKGRPPRD